MKEMILEPYNVGLKFKMDYPMAAAQWGKMIAEILETLGRHCQEAGPCVIGHIKGFADTPGNGFLKVSVISPDHPADVETKSTNDFSELSLTLIVLVYGHSKKVLVELTQKTLNLSEKPWSGQVTLKPVEHGHIHINESSHS